MAAALVCRVHHFSFNAGKYAVNEHFQRVEGPRCKPVTVDRIALHHYVLKSEEVRMHLCLLDVPVCCEYLVSCAPPLPDLH